MKYTTVLMLTLCIGQVTTQGLMQSLLDFASLNAPDSGDDNNTAWDENIVWDSTPDPFSPADQPFPFDFPVEPPVTTNSPFPTDSPLPPDNTIINPIPLPGDIPGAGGNSVVNTPGDQIAESGQTNVGSGTDNSPVDKSAILPLPPFEVNAVDSGTTRKPFDLAAQFLPNIPQGKPFLNLQTGQTKPFKPDGNWLGGVNPASGDDGGNLPIETTTPANRPTTTDVPTTTPSSMGPDMKIPIEGGRGHIAGTVVGVVMGTQPDNSILPGPGNKIPIDTEGIPLGLAIGIPVDQTPQEKAPNGKGNGVPKDWMTLYPNGRPPKRTGAVSSVPVDLTPMEFWLAQNTLNSFSRDRQASMRYRKERRDKAKQRRKLRQQQRQQNKKNNRQKQPNKGPRGARVAKMVLPNSNRPFVGKTQRGRNLRRKCNKLQQRRGLCSPDEQTINASWKRNGPNFIKEGSKRIKRRANGRGKGGRGKGRGGKGRGGRWKGNGRKGAQKRNGKWVQNAAGLQQEIINLQDTQSNSGQIHNNDPLALGQPGDLLQTGNGGRKNKGPRGKKWKKRNKVKKPKKPKAIKKLVPVDLTGQVDLPKKVETVTKGPTEMSSNVEIIGGMLIDWGETPPSSYEKIPGFGNIEWRPPQETGKK